MKKILINDITLRDGEQAAGVNFFPEEKLRIAKQLAKMRVPIIEAGFAIASKADFKAIQLISSKLGTKDGPVICAMARANKKDIDSAKDSVNSAAKARVQVVLGTSDIHIKYKFNKTRREIKRLAYEMVKYAKTLIDDVEFAAEDATRSDIDFLIDVFKVCIKAGARTLEIPDTVGYSTPNEYYEIVKAVVKNVPKDIVVATHCHNDLGLAVANTLAGIMAGARQVETTINGIGERVGNAAFEEVVMALKTRKNFYKIELDINTKEIINTSRLVEELSGIKIADNKPVVGRNAFRHESGIHQDGLLKNKETYQIIEPTDIGLDGYGLVLGKLSGMHALKDKIIKSGYSLTEDEFSKIYENFKDLASKKKFILDEDIFNLVNKIKDEKMR